MGHRISSFSASSDSILGCNSIAKGDGAFSPDTLSILGQQYLLGNCLNIVLFEMFWYDVVDLMDILFQFKHMFQYVFFVFSYMIPSSYFHDIHCQSLLASTKLCPASSKPGDLQQWLQLCQRAQAIVLLWLQKAGVLSIVLLKDFSLNETYVQSTLLIEDSTILVFALGFDYPARGSSLLFSLFFFFLMTVISRFLF